MANSLTPITARPLPIKNVIRPTKPEVSKASPLQDTVTSLPDLTLPGRGVGHLFQRLIKGDRWAELQQTKAVKKATKKLSTPDQFRAQTARFKARLEAGETLEDIRPEVYAVASRACEVALGMEPYDCQLVGALALGSNEIAEMMTGEGKTLTAVMPLYLHALAGKGAHLVTVNDTLAQRDAKEMGPAFELLGMSVGTVLDGMTPEEKRQGYAADVTYTTDRTLGFDYLRDKTAKSIEEKVQREPFFALVDEVDEVLLDEARTPLIISGRGEAPSVEYQTFDQIVDDLKPGIDYFVDREQGSAWLSELGLEYVENELHGLTLDRKDPLALAEYHRKAGAIRKEGKAYRALLDHQKEKPGLLADLMERDWDQKQATLEEKYKLASETTDTYPDPYNLFSEQNQHRFRYLHASLKAHALFEEGVDYIIQDERVKIVDENKGRTSRGRRFNEGLHQALEAKSGVPLRPESRPVASITYPNLFKHYPHLSGMSGTAKTSEAEFQKLYDLRVTKVPTNLQFESNPDNPEKAPRHNRTDHPDQIFSTKEEKFQAVADEAVKAFEEGVPVLLGTLSVEANNYLHAKLLERGVNPAAIQVLNAEHVRGDKSLENSIVKQAGRSGMITVATNMAGRGVNIKPDFVNYKKLAMEIERTLGTDRQPVVVDVRDRKEAEKLSRWLNGSFPHRIGEGAPGQGETLIRIASKEAPPHGLKHLKSEDYPTGGLYVIGTERAKSRRIDDQLIGRAGRQGQPGRSKFFLSLQDDLVHELAKHKLGAGLEHVTGAQESDFVNGLVRKAQSRLAEMDLHSREQTGLFDEVLNTQREAYYEIRESILDPQADLRCKLYEDSSDYVRGFLEQHLPERGKVEPLKIRSVVSELNEKLKLSVGNKWTESAPREDVVEAALYDLERALDRSVAQFDESEAGLDKVYRQALLTGYDQAWSEHLESMDLLKSGVQWVGTVGEKPEDAFKRRGFETFSSTLDLMRDRSVEENLPQILVGAKVLRRDRELQAQAG